MRSILSKSFLTIVFLLILNLGCNKDEIVESSAKDVVGFTAGNSVVSSMPLRITNDHKIIIEAVCPTYQGDIKVSPVVSPKAKCSLAPGTIIDLHKTNTFTVTAEDGSTQIYSIYIQGCSLYGSYFYRSCNKKRVIDCIVQDRIPQVSNSNIVLHFKELSDSSYPEDDFKVSLDLSDDNFKSGILGTYNINPIVGKESKASFIFSSNVLIRTVSPSGKITITNVDTINKVFSGSFYFSQKSDDTCASNTDYITGEFYSVPF